MLYLAQISRTEVIQRLVPSGKAGLCLLIVAGMICWLVFRFRAYWRDDTEGDASLHEMLSQFRESEREGVLSAEEYRLIKGRLMQRIKPATETERQPLDGSTSNPAKGIANSLLVRTNDETRQTQQDSPPLY